MISRFKRLIFFSVAVAVYLTMASIVLGADTKTNSTEEQKTRPSGVLTNAANAAQSAANAANAAANAANAAAKAATAAFDAINSISQSSPATQPTDAAATQPAFLPSSPALSASPLVNDPALTPLPEDVQTPSTAGAGKFFVPLEQSLVGLVGKFEIPVFVDAGGDLAKSLTGYQAPGSETVKESSETNLAESIWAGRGFSRDTLTAGARVDQAKAQAGQALAILLPSVFIRGSIGSETSTPSVALDPATGRPIDSDTHSRTDASLVVRQPLLDLPSLVDWRRRRVIEQSRNESYRVSDGDAYVSTINAYLALVSSRLLADMTRDFEVQLKELFVYIEKRAKAGAANFSDMARVRARSMAAISSRMEQESAHAAAGIEFVRLTNQVPRMVRLPELNDVGASMLPESLDLAVNLAMTQNPDIASLAAEVQAATIDKSSAKSRFLPTVALEYSDTYSQHAGGETSEQGQRDKRLMMVLNWSLFSGGGDYQYHNERSARERELKYRLDDQHRRVAQMLSTNYGTISSVKERLAIGYKELKSISVAAEAMSKRMLYGNQSLLDLLDVYDRYYQARVRLVSLHVLEMNTVAQTLRLVKGAPAADSAMPVNTGNKVVPKEQPPPLANEKPVLPEAEVIDTKQVPLEVAPALNSATPVNTGDKVVPKEQSPPLVTEKSTAPEIAVDTKQVPHKYRLKVNNLNGH